MLFNDSNRYPVVHPLANRIGRHLILGQCNWSEASRGGSRVTTAAHKKAPVLLGSAIIREDLQNRGVGDTGLEPVTPSLSSWCSSQLS